MGSGQVEEGYGGHFSVCSVPYSAESSEYILSLQLNPRLLGEGNCVNVITSLFFFYSFYSKPSLDRFSV